MVKMQFLAYDVSAKATVPAKDITLTINPGELRFTSRIGRWRKRLSMNTHFPFMSTVFRYPDQQANLTIRMNEEDLDTWIDRSKGNLSGSERHGVIFNLKYNRQRPGQVDVAKDLGFYVIESMDWDLAESSARVGNVGGQLEWVVRIILSRVTVEGVSDTGL